MMSRNTKLRQLNCDRIQKWMTKLQYIPYKIDRNLCIYLGVILQIISGMKDPQADRGGRGDENHDG